MLVAVVALTGTLATAHGSSAKRKQAPPPALSGRIQSGPWYDTAGNASWVKLRVPVELVDANGAVRGQVTPDQWGEWRFAHVAPGTYRVRFTYPAYHDLTPTRTWISPQLTWGPRTSWEILVDIDPYTNNPSYEVITKRTRCPGVVPAGVGCNR